MDQNKAVAIAIVCVVLLGLVCAAAWILWDIETIKGNEIGVLETWSGGVDKKPRSPKTYFLFPGYSQIMYKYPISLNLFVMNNIPQGTETAEGRAVDAYEVQSKEGQTMKVSLNVQWRIDPTKVIEIHKTVSPPVDAVAYHVGERLLRPVVMRIVKDQATMRLAIEAYSGDGLVKLQTDIHRLLSDPNGELCKKGVLVENFVIEGIELDKAYIGEITQRQVAMQKKLKEDELTKAADASALRVKAEAQADYNKQVVAAERDKAVGILKAEEQAKVQVLAAEAEKQKLVLEATGNRDADVLRAEGLLAVGKAEAEAKKLALSAYAVSGADAFVRIEVARAFAESMSQVKGYLPSDMHIFTLGKHFEDAIGKISGSK
jgi:regulator of protease activity HflC (stomatin/prohibitin superfamily)